MRTGMMPVGHDVIGVILAVLVAMPSLACTPAASETRPGAELSSDEPTTGGGVAPRDGPEVGAPPTPARTTTVLGRYDFERGTPNRPLPGRLDEISGLAFTEDGRLFAHDDERARVHEIDPRTGEVGKRFDLGPEVVAGDFEGLAIAGDRFFLITSVGFLYEFREGDDRATLGYRVTDTGVGRSCEVEGLDHDPFDDALLIACKVVAPDGGDIVVHRIPLDPETDPMPPLRVPKAALVQHDLDPDFDPSAIVVDPSGAFLLLAGRQQAIIEVDRAGNVVAGVGLPRSRHRQPEGLEIGPDLTLHIADERNRRDARWTTYARVDTAGSG
jgi:uncharacterized protein YjiK